MADITQTQRKFGEKEKVGNGEKRGVTMEKWKFRYYAVHNMIFSRKYDKAYLLDSPLHKTALSHFKEYLSIISG